MTALPSSLPPATSVPVGAAPSGDRGAGTAATSGEEHGFRDLLLASLPEHSAPSEQSTEHDQGADEAGVAPTSGLLSDAVAAAGASAVLAPIPVALAAALRGGAASAAEAALDLAAPGLPAETETSPVSSAGSTAGSTAAVDAASPAASAQVADAAPLLTPAPGNSGTVGGAGESATSDSSIAPELAALTGSPSSEGQSASTAEESGAGRSAGPSPSGPLAPSAASSAGTPAAFDVSGLTAVQGTAAVTAPSTAASPTSATAPAPPVAQQVMPEVTRLVQRGDGTHRVTLTLSPEALGDVQVTLTLVKGAVTVSFAAADLAQRALMESAPELRRLLELTGAHETRILVRDQNTPLTAAPTASSAQDSGDRGTDADGTRRDGAAGGSEQNSEREAQARQQAADQFAEHLSGRAGADPQNQRARMRDGFTAMDGNTRGTGNAGTPLDPATSARTRRVDVTA